MHYILSVSKPTNQDIKDNLPESMTIKRGEEWHSTYIIALVGEIEKIDGIASANHFKKSEEADEVRIVSSLNISELSRIINPLFEKSDKHQGSWWCKLVNNGIVQV